MEQDKLFDSTLPDVTQFTTFVQKTWPDILDPHSLECDYKEAFPGIDLLAEARKAWIWEQAAAGNRKRNHKKFLSNWMSRAKATKAVANVYTNDEERKRLSNEQAERDKQATKAYIKKMLELKHRTPPKEAISKVHEILKKFGER